MGLGEFYPENGEEFARALLNSEDPQMAGITLEKLCEEDGAVELVGTEDPLGPEVGYELATPSGRQEPYYENLIEWGQAFPQWEEPNEIYAGNPLRDKYPLAFTQSRFSLPRAFDLLGRHVDSAALRAAASNSIPSKRPRAALPTATRLRCSTTAAASPPSCV